MTLPPSDSFWDTYFPPNGWNCRCTVVQVRKDAAAPTDHDEAMRLGRTALKGDKKGMFDFNSGKQERTFPKYNPYTISKCRTCPKANLKLAAGVADSDVCEACITIKSQIGVPPEVDKYESLYGGQVLVSPYHGQEEREANLELAKKMSDLLGKPIYLLPRLDSNTSEQLIIRERLLPNGIFEKKNPDFYDGEMFYDGKSLYGFSGKTNKEQYNAVRNHIKHASKQANNYVLDIPDTITSRNIIDAVYGYFNCSKRSHRIIIFHKGEGYIYEKQG